MKRFTPLVALAALACSGAGSSPPDAPAADPGPDADVTVDLPDTPEAGEVPDASPDDAPADVAADAPDGPPPGPRLGTFLVQEGLWLYTEATNRNVNAFGRFQATAAPEFLVAAKAGGGCTLWTYAPGACPGADGTGCLYDEVCTAAGTCAAWPAAASAGPATLSGLSGHGPVTIQPDPSGYYVAQWGYPPPTSVLDPGTEVTLAAQGADLPGFTMTAAGVADLVVDEAAYRDRRLQDEDTTFTWTPGDPGGRVRLTLPSVNQCHGCPSLGRIECDVPDTGSLVVPGDLVAALPRAMSGICVGIDCPRATLSRYRSAWAALPQGVVELRVESVVGFGIDHDAR